jgi:hypothetical protein
MANKDEELKYEKDDFHNDIAHTNYDLAENKEGKELSSPNIGKTLSQNNISLPSSKRRLNRTDMNVENNKLK